MIITIIITCARKLLLEWTNTGERESEKKKYSCCSINTEHQCLPLHAVGEKKGYYKWVHCIGLLDKCTSAVLHSWLFNLLADFLPFIGYNDPSTEWVSAVFFCLNSLSEQCKSLCFVKLVSATRRKGLLSAEPGTWHCRLAGIWLHTKWRKRRLILSKCLPLPPLMRTPEQEHQQAHCAYVISAAVAYRDVSCFGSSL